MPRLRKLHEKRGFALILVFSLAAIILLLSLSLVSLTQIETASSRYDQGMHLARANARLALDMAIGDLQEFAGPDQRITATADGARSGAYIADNFNDATDPAMNGVYQPFWTGVWNNDNSNDNPVWLVTRPLDTTYALDSGTQEADPFVSDYGAGKPLVKLVGAESAKPENPGTGQDEYDIYVPKELVASDEIVGLAASEESTVGHYAYWVGDNGVKASYLLEDNVPEVLHDIYDSGGATYENRRLSQMAAHRYFLEMEGLSASPRLMDATDLRLSTIVSEFAISEEIDSGDSLLGSFTHNDVLRRYHDFSGLSKGLLVDTARGGLKEDLSNIHRVSTGDSGVDDLVNNYLMPYLNVSDIPTTSPNNLRRAYSIAPKNTTFGGGGPTPAIAPLITEFWMVIRMSAPELGVGADDIEKRQSDIYGQFGVVVELWNPYTSRINGDELRIRIENPHADGLMVNYYDNWDYGDLPTASHEIPNFGLEDVMDGVSEFTLDTSGTGWKPGEVRVFKGSYVPVLGNPGAGILDLTTGTEIRSFYDYPIPELSTPVTKFKSLDDDYAPDRLELVGPAWTPEISLRTSDGDELYRFILDGVSFYEMRSSPTLVYPSPSAERHLSYKWELRNPDSSWTNYDPRSGSITADVIMDNFDRVDPPPGYLAISMSQFEFPGGKASHDYFFQGSSFDLLGHNEDASIENNIPLFELPRQDYLSLAGLQMAEFPSEVKAHLGASIASINPTPSINDIFDRFFLSTVPQSGSTTWTVGDPLPNSRMEPATGAILSDLQDPDSAGHLYLNGAFNVNSTSFEAWTAMLKGVRLGTWAYDDPLGATPVDGQSEVDLMDESQFFRFSQTAEETWLGSYTATDLDKSRAFFREGMRSLTDTEIATLVTEIIRAIRARRQEVSAPMGPFASLQDFIDSGVLETAIANANLNSAIQVDGKPLVYASSYLTQQDILNAIAPYLTVRSDTFLIRAYGDAVNPFDDAEVVARAYCEAIVQRVHEKHSTESPASLADPRSTTDNTAGSLGRDFRIIAFRWLTGDEI